MLAASILVLVLTGGPGVLAADPARRVAVTSSPAVARKIAIAEEAATGGDWNQASEILRSVAESTPDELVEIKPGHFVRVLDHVDDVIERWPAAGLQAYRARIDAAAETQLDLAVLENDLPRLQRVVDRFAHSTFGRSALWRLGGAYWERGELGRAREAWERLAEVDRSAPSSGGDVSRPDLLAALVLCSIMEGDLPRAEREYKVFRDEFPTEPGRLGEQEGRLAELLAAQLEQARIGSICSDRFEVFPRRAPGQPVWVGFGRLNWLTLDQESPREIEAAASPAMLNELPAADGSRLFLVEPTRIRALRLEDGAPAWPTGEADDRGTIYRKPPSLMLDFSSTGVATLSGVLASGRLIAVAGPCVAAAPRDALPYLTPPVVALETAAEGRLLWSQGLEHPLAQQGWSPLGRPVANGRGIWVPIQRTAAPYDVGVARLRPEDGGVEWAVSVCTPFTGGPSNVIRYDDCWLTLGVRDLYLSTNSGALAAVDADSGVTRWIDAATGRDLNERELNHRDYNRSSPPVVWQGMVLLAPRGSGAVLAWDARNGRRLWETNLKERGLQLCGVSADRLIATGRRLWSLNPESGTVTWRFGFDDEDGAGAGPAAISAGRITWSTRRELFLFDVSGEMLDRLDLRSRYGLSGGSLLAAGQRLILRNSQDLAVFEMATGE